MSIPDWWSQPPGPRGGGAILSCAGLLAVYLGILAPLANHRAPALTQLACSLFGSPSQPQALLSLYSVNVRSWSLVIHASPSSGLAGSRFR